MSKKPAPSDAPAVAEKQRAMQRVQDARDAKSEGSTGRPSAASESNGAVQAGAREHPSKLPAQHIEKPGHESELQLKPQFLAPGYEGSHKLQDMATLVTGGDSGIGRAVAVLFAREGADVGIVYLDEHDDAEETQRCIESEGRRCVLIPGDVKDAAFCTRAVDQVVSAFGKLAAPDERRVDHQHRIGHRARGQCPAARLFGHQGRDPRLHQGAGAEPGRQRHPRQRGRARAGVDAAESGRFAG